MRDIATHGASPCDAGATSATADEVCASCSDKRADDLRPLEKRLREEALLEHLTSAGEALPTLCERARSLLPPLISARAVRIASDVQVVGKSRTA